MTTAKTDAFELTVSRAAAFAKALAHPARIQILQVLARKKTCVCGEVVSELPLAQSTVSQHLKALKQAGLITGEIDGPAVCYCIDARAFNSIRKEFVSILDSITADVDCC
ncbi:MAG: winged helix-turn-helix transcriptional regulator [Rhodothermales bacterium]|nr:winged helix-turn-helix transcriptional regulator [Rhodothermales bacterium]